ncbi:MAG: hydroxyacylglutathione hydrolase [Candidatus Bathyarchaeota archaeon BA1]|nr:MAG: hydroxyacylglutathione hydrolase [Candidatus Bathyarchaeota archaeon BA1]
MFVKMLTVGMLYTNCYIVGCAETGEALIIDPGLDKDAEAKMILKEVDQHNLRVKYIVNTHGHPDHTSGNGIIKKATDAPILIHEDDAIMLSAAGKSLVRLFGFHVVSPQADRLLHNGDVIQVGRVRLKVVHTPGHSRGSISLLGEDTVFTGDTLFAGSIGRTDLPGASYKEIMRSIRGKLAKLPDHMNVYPGHGPASTIGEEKRNNPFLQDFLFSSMT